MRKLNYAAVPLTLLTCTSALAENTPPAAVEALQTTTIIADDITALNATESLLTDEEVERLQASSVQQMLDILPGVSMAGSPRPGSQTINIRGFGTYDIEDVQLRLDGAPKLFQKYQQGSLFVEPELLKEVNVSKGPHSALYGNGGTGGVVNMTTKDADDLLQPGQNIGGFVKSGFQSNMDGELYSGAIYYGGDNNPLDMVLNFTKRKAGDLEDGDGNVYKYSGTDSDSGLLKLGYDFENGHRVSLSHIMVEDASRTPWAAKRGLFEASDYEIRRYGEELALLRKTVWRETDDKTSVFKHSYSDPQGGWLNTDFSMSYSTSSQHDTRPDEASKYSGSNMGNESWTDYKTLFAELKNTQEIDVAALSHTLTYGVQYLKEDRAAIMRDNSKEGREQYNNGYYQPWYMPSGQQTVLSAFVQDEINMGKLTVTPSLRYDHVSIRGDGNLASRFNNPDQGHNYDGLTYTHWSPRLGLFYRANDELSYFANLTRTSRAPGVDEAYDVGSSQPTSRALKPEVTTAGELGLVKTLSNQFQNDDSLKLRTSVFYTRVENEIARRLGNYYVKDDDGDSLPNQSPYTNINGKFVRGLEVEAYYDSNNVFGQLSLSMMDSRVSGTPRDPNGPNVPVNEVAPPEVNMMLGYKFPAQHLTVGWRGKYAHKSDRNARDIDPDKAALYTTFTETPSYAVHNLFMDWYPQLGFGAADATKISIYAENITDKHYVPYLNEGIAGTGRNIKISLTQKF